MPPIEIFAQGIGVVAMFFNILSYQCKKQKTIIVLQLLGSALFAVNFLLLGALVGGILNMICVVRAVVYLYKDKLKADRWPWLALFIATYLTSYILNFTVFGKAPTAWNLLVEMIPVIGTTAINVGFMLKDAASVRKCALVGSPCWLTYNLIVFSLGAILCEVFTLCSVGIGMLRLDKKKALEEMQ